MSANTHPHYKMELEKLDYTLAYLENYHNSILKVKTRIDKDVDYGVRHYNSDNAEQFNELIINTTMQDNLSQKLKNLEKSHSKPYFARVDFTDKAIKKRENLYIGKISLLREEDNEFIIVDWRAPVANLYYEGRLGKASYTCPDGEITGNIDLKRQYTIEKGQLQEIYDIDITTNDDFLQACLGSSKDNRLKDIVSTIQAEQNKVIRADMWKPLIVQGAAGGGKTTIALHRIAYLLYNYEKTLSPKNFMIIAPNRFFLSYISEVLPELGVENVKQTTFEDFFMEVMDKKFKLKNSHEKLSILIDKGSSGEKDRIKAISEFKTSLVFKDILLDYIRLIEGSFFPREDFKIHTYTLFKAKELQKLFTQEYKYLPMYKRTNEIKKHLVNTLKREKVSILDSIEHQADMELQNIRDNMRDCQERRNKIIEITSNRDNLIEKIKKHSKTLVREFLSKIKPLSPMDYYFNLLQDKHLFKSLAQKYLDTDSLSMNDTTLDNILEHSTKLFSSGAIENEDIAPLMLLKHEVYGLDDELNLKHIIIDEAQDFSLFQLFVLKSIVKSGSFTILGDLCQGIHSYRGIKDWKQAASQIFDNEASLLTLEQSYRTTIEIMDAANSLIRKLQNKNLPPAKPVIRHGEKVQIIEKKNIKEIAQAAALNITAMKEKGFKSAAIICKTLEECLKFKKTLACFGISPQIITGSEKEYSGGVVIVPSHLVKGLEFDIVIVANASKEEYSDDELDIKLLYVAMTRPLHELHIYSLGERAAVLNDVANVVV